MTPVGFVISYGLVALTILLAIQFKRRRLDRWQRGMPRQLVGGQRARFNHVNTERSSTKPDDDRGRQRRAA
jgi:hypothetical protein